MPTLDLTQDELLCLYAAMTSLRDNGYSDGSPMLDVDAVEDFASVEQKLLAVLNVAELGLLDPQNPADPTNQPS